MTDREQTRRDAEAALATLATVENKTAADELVQQLAREVLAQLAVNDQLRAEKARDAK